MNIIAENRKAYFNYQILEKLEAGISLTGNEVKSIKNRKVSLKGNYVIIKDQEAFWVGANIPPYQPKNVPPDYNPERSRKLLLKKTEIKYLIGKSKQKGLTLVPLKLYIKRGKIKLEFGVGKGRKKTSKKELLKKRATEREIQRTLKENGG